MEERIRAYITVLNNPWMAWRRESEHMSQHKITLGWHGGENQSICHSIK